MGTQGSSSITGSIAETCNMLKYDTMIYRLKQVVVLIAFMQTSCGLVTWIFLSLTERLSLACSEGIPDVALNACAGGHVVHDPAPCIDATSPRAWVDALVPLACFV